MAYRIINGFGFIFKRLKPQEVLGVPSGDDLPEVEDNDIQIFFKNGSTLYIYDGTEWQPVGGEGVGSFEPVITAPDDGDKFWNGNKEFVEISSSQINEGTKLFFTSARARAAISVAQDSAISYDPATGILDLTLPSQAQLSAESPVLFDEETGTFSLDLSVLDARYQPSEEEYNIEFTTGLQKVGNDVSALTDNALWNAKKLQGYLISSEEPTENQILVFDATLKTWILKSDWINDLEEYENNTAAIAGGLPAGKLYKLPYDAANDVQLIAIAKEV